MRSAVIMRHNLALLAREPGPVLSRIGMPLVLITVLRPLFDAALGSDGVRQGVTGMLVFFSLLGLSLIGGGVLTERSWRTLDRLRVSPAQPREILVGKAVPYGCVLLTQQAVVVGYGVTVLGLHVARVDLLVLAGVTWAVTLLCFGAALATIVSSHSGLSAVTDIGGLLLTVLGGAMLPLDLLPPWVAAVAPASPGYWALTALRSSVAGDAAATLRAVGVLAAVAAALGAFAGWRLARGWGRGRTA
jgi:ABC-2 type transport system permease protein